ncbi:MAG: hypothetical protein KAS32_05635 [Candidatus Peribacteraceae bacterium]|nr:hypothetical protein [Candidatus Peribacteraceae bacterium]
MTTPTYSHDLTDVDLAESTTSWDYWGGPLSMGFGPDFSMQGINCVDGKVSSAEKGLYFDNGFGITLGTGDHVFLWGFLATPGLADTLQNGGLSAGVGSDSNNYCKYHVEGNDTYGAIGRVGVCYTIDYSLRTSSISPPYRTLVGSPAANPRVFGIVTNTTGSVKGSNLGADAVRYGTGAYLTAGELISAGDASDDPCSFDEFATENDRNETDNYNRWGILTRIGKTYQLQGRFVIGQNNSKTATLCRFKDSDRNIEIVDTPHAASDFTQIIIDHASTRVELDNINITALGTTNPGQFNVLSNNPTVLINGGIWTDIGVVSFRSNTTVDGLTLRRTDAITPNGGSLENCIIDSCNAASAVIAANLNEVVIGEFISDGTGHAFELTGAASTYTWNCTTIGYDTGSTGDGVEVTGGSITGDETIHITATTGTFNISVSDGATTPSVSSAGAVVNVVAGQKTLTVDGLVAGESEVRVRDGSVTLPGGYIATNPTTQFQMTFDPFAVENKLKLQITTPSYDYINKDITLFNADVTIDVTTEMIPDPSWIPSS